MASEPTAEPGAPGSGLCLVRGGGDLATGIVWRLTRAGRRVVVCELPEPLTVRRTVAVSTAVREGTVEVEGMRAELVASTADAVARTEAGVVAVLVSPELPGIVADVVVDARVAKRNIDTGIDDAPLVVGIGPGFTAGVDCHAVVETRRGRHLGRVFWQGSAAPDTGIVGEVGGRSGDRVLRAPAAGTARWEMEIGDLVEQGRRLGEVAGIEIRAPFTGVVRGLIHPGVEVHEGLKIGDVDPRGEGSLCREISDKALAVGGGVVEAVLTRGAARG